MAKAKKDKEQEQEILFDDHNYRIHNDKNKALIRKSLENLGGGRSIFLDNENKLIAGNGVYEQAQALKIPVKIIETDGSEIIAVKRIDLATSDPKRRELAIMDNTTSDTGEMDLQALALDFETAELVEFGIDVTGLDVATEDMPELPTDDDEKPFEQITFLLSRQQADDVRKAIEKAKEHEFYGEYCETQDNTNSNGNALAIIISEWSSNNG